MYTVLHIILSIIPNMDMLWGAWVMGLILPLVYSNACYLLNKISTSSVPTKAAIVILIGLDSGEVKILA